MFYENGQVYHWTEESSDADYRTYAPGGSIGVWTHVAAVRVGSTVTIYIDGVEVTSDANAGTVADIEEHVITIGCRTNSGGVFQDQFNGYIDDVWLFDSALSSGLILALYNGYEYSNDRYWFILYTIHLLTVLASVEEQKMRFF